MKTLFLKELKCTWADAVLFGKVFSYKNHPLRSHPLAYGLLFPESPPANLLGLSFSELCQLAILRAPFDGASLAKALSPFVQFPTLWSQEQTFDPVETKLSIDLFLHLLGNKEPFLGDLPSYYKALLTRAKIGGDPIEVLPLGSIESFGAIQAAFIHQGKETALGALHFENIEVPAFGPHLHPLNDSSSFGIDMDSFPWAQISGDKEVWLHRNPIEAGFEIQMFGLKASRRVSFVFYVKAENAYIENKEFIPKTLSRFSDLADTVTFQNKGSSLIVKSTSKVKVELIPLAGDESFFGSTFLLGFEVPIFDGKLGFQFY